MTTQVQLEWPDVVGTYRDYETGKAVTVSSLHDNILSVTYDGKVIANDAEKGDCAFVCYWRMDDGNGYYVIGLVSSWYYLTVNGDNAEYERKTFGQIWIKSFEDAIRESDIVGGEGNEFSIVPLPDRFLQTISIYFGDVVNAIEAVYGLRSEVEGIKSCSTTVSSKPDSDGAKKSHDLASLEVVTKVSIKYATRYFDTEHIVWIKIETNLGNSIEGGSGAYSEGISDEISFTAQPGEAIVAFYGRNYTHTDGTEFISALGVGFQKLPV